MIAHVCELEEYLILSTKNDNRIVIVNQEYKVAKIINSKIQIASLNLIGYSNQFLFVATKSGTLRLYEVNKLISETQSHNIDFFTPEQEK